MLFGRVGAILKNVVGHEVVINGIRKATDAMAGRARKLLDEDLRRIVTTTILRLSGSGEASKQAAAETLFRRLARAKETSEPDIEDEVVRSMGRLLVDETGKVVVSDDVADAAFAALAELSDDDFGVVVEAMTHDPIAQRARYFLQNYGPLALRYLRHAAGFIGGAANELNDELQPMRNRLREQAGTRGWRSWLVF